MTIAKRFENFGTTIFSEMTQLAVKHQAVNLSQGFPDFDGPDFVKNAAIKAINDGHNQYARMFGLPELNNALAARWNRLTGQSIDPNKNVQVTTGCTEAIPSVFLGLLNPGDEVILFEPYYDSYRPCCAMAGAVPRFVTLHWPDFAFDPDELRKCINPGRTRAIVINTPHNPTGKVFSLDELQFIADLCQEYNLLAITDEVYENLVFDGEHIRMATLPCMAERTITMSSLGKTFSLTGWKVGWVSASENLIAGVRAAHQFLTFATATPFQHGAVAAINAPDIYFTEFLSMYRKKRDMLCDALEDIGFIVARPAGTYFIFADHTPFGFADDVTFCKHLVTELGIAAIPPTAFYENRQHGKSLVRFAFCKTEETLHKAIEKLQPLKTM